MQHIRTVMADRHSFDSCLRLRRGREAKVWNDKEDDRAMFATDRREEVELGRQLGGDDMSPGGEPWAFAPSYRDEIHMGRRDYACLDLGDGRMVKTEVLYSGYSHGAHVTHATHSPPVANYELFAPSPTLSQMSQMSHMTPAHQTSQTTQTPQMSRTTYDEWSNDMVDSYDPFGRNFLQRPSPPVERPVKKRIVAEVKPMRPSYSSVLSKVPKSIRPVDVVEPKKPNGDLPRPDPEKPPAEERKKIRVQRPPSDFPRTEPSTPKTEPRPLPTPRPESAFPSEPGTPVGGPTRKPTEVPEETRPKKKKNRNRKETERTIEPDESVEINDADESDDVRTERPVETERVKKKNPRQTRPNPKNQDRGKKTGQPKSKKSKGFDYMNLLRVYIDTWIALSISALLWVSHLVVDVSRLSIRLSIDLFSSMMVDLRIRSQSLKRGTTLSQYLSMLGNAIDEKYGDTYFGFWRKFKHFKKNGKTEPEMENQRKHTNIPLPLTGEEAMKRLLACKGKDPYSILGVGVQCSDDDIKRYYRKQAFLVHPDKNQQPGAEEAFKILQHAFDMIGEPERREAYERDILEMRNAEAARSELADLVAKLQEKVRRAVSTIRCSRCSGRHPRTPTSRPCWAARYCSQCNIHHSAKEGDIWAESKYWGLVWTYYACMDGAVYQITQWASCQKKNLKHVKANMHHVQYRIVLGNKPQPGNGGKTTGPNINADFESFLNNLYTKANPQAGRKGSNWSNNQTGDGTKNKRAKKYY